MLQQNGDIDKPIGPGVIDGGGVFVGVDGKDVPVEVGVKDGFVEVGVGVCDCVGVSVFVGVPGDGV